MMKYKGYQGQVAYDSDVKIFHGEVIGLGAVLTFQGTTVNDIEEAFKDTVEDYLDWCKERKVFPEKPFSGNIRIHVSVKLHEKIAQIAFLQGMSVNGLVVEKLQR